MQVLSIEKMEQGRFYTIRHAERVPTPLGPTVIFITEDRSKENLIYLPRRYAHVVADDDIKMINSARVWPTVMCRGFCDYRQIPLLEIIDINKRYN
jgi:hypothetical protein